jgi:hypothetical protein
VSEAGYLPPRVLIVMRDQWTRVLLRAALREVGYDAVGTRNLRSAMRIRVGEPDRAPVRLMIVDQDAADDVTIAEQLLERHGAVSILIARRTSATPAGPWHRVIYRPISVEEIVRVVEDMLPLEAKRQHPLD